jgi:hypothetical protein
MRTSAILFVVVLGALAALGGACSGTSPSTPSSTTGNVIVVGAAVAPTPLPGFVIASGAAGRSDIPLTCSELSCFATIKLQNTGTGCAGNVDGNVNVFSAPATPSSLLTTSSSGFLIPNNPILKPGQIVSVNVAIPVPAVDYIVIAVLNWTSPTCP